jgi:hypothetical protein
MNRTYFNVKIFGRYIDAGRLFTLCIISSFVLHASMGGMYLFKTLLIKEEKVIESLFDLIHEDIEFDIPPELIETECVSRRGINLVSVLKWFIICL